MSHFAEIDNKNIVIRVLKCDNNEPDEVRAWLVENLGGTWIQTSYNARIRKHYAATGYTYDPTLDAFIPPQPYPSWTLDADCNWQPPTPRPEGDQMYTWNESILEWETL